MVGGPQHSQPVRAELQGGQVVLAQWWPHTQHLQELPPRQTFVQSQELGGLLSVLKYQGVSSESVTDHWPVPGGARELQT